MSDSKPRFKKGERVMHEYLGAGTIFQDAVDFLVWVKFDKTPSREYNMSQNPTTAIDRTLKRIE